MIWVEEINKNTDNTSHDSQNSKIININNKKSARLLSKRKQLSINNQPSDSEAANSSEKLYLIDFGLGFHSRKIEDKAVDLHLLKQAIEAKHFKISDECIKIILDNYNAKMHKEIIQRIKTIESRGRYKH
jgi:Kae1-associated kinase Bud32